MILGLAFHFDILLDEDDILDSDFTSTDEEDLIDEQEFEKLIKGYGSSRKKDTYIVEDEEEIEKQKVKEFILYDFDECLAQTQFLQSDLFKC